MTKRELSKRIEEVRGLIGYNYGEVEMNKKFNDYKKQSEQKINNLRGYIGSHTWAISVNNEIKYLKAVVSKNDDKYEMLLDYFKLEEKEYAELEEQGKFRTFKDVSNLIGEPINIEAVKKTKLVKRK